MEDVVVLPGGQWQRDLVLFLKQKGHRVIIVNPIRTPTTELADIFLSADIRDKQLVSLMLLSGGFRPSYVFTDQSSNAIATANHINRTFGLFHQDDYYIGCITDKGDMYWKARALGIPTPHSSVCTHYGELRDFFVMAGGPIVVKPTANESSVGVTIVNDLEQLKEAYEQAVGRSNKPFTNRWEVIAQHKVNGWHVCVEGIIVRGRHRCLAFGVQQHSAPGVVSSIRYGQMPVDAFMMESMVRAADSFMESLSIQTALTHVEFIANCLHNKFWLIEASSCGGGASISSVVMPHVTGINVYEVWYNCLTGRAISDFPDPISRPALLQFYETNSEPDLDALRIIDNVHTFHPVVESGPQTPIRKDSDRYSLAVILAKSNSEIDEAKWKVDQQLKDSNGSDWSV